MSSEQDKPPPDAIQPGPPAPTGAGPAGNGQVTTPAPSGPNSQIAAGPPRPPAPARPPAAPGQHTEAGLLRWMFGMAIVLVAGWGFIAFVGLLAVTFRVGISLTAAGMIASVLSLGFFLALEQNLWLSRFLGLRLSPRAHPVTEAVVFWLFGVVGLLLRSTVPPTREAAAAPATGVAAIEKGKATPPEA